MGKMGNRRIGMRRGHYAKPTGMWCVWLVLLAVSLPQCDGSEDRAQGARIIVASSPESDGEVFINGMPRGQTPLTLEYLRPGSMVIEVKKDGYKPGYEIVDVPTEGEHRIVIQLEPRAGYVTLDSDPFPAKVFLDEEFVGETPLINRPFLIGTHTYRISFPNYQPVQKTVTIEEDFRYTWSHPLQPMKAQLAVLSVPTGADITLNDLPQAKTTPATLELVPDTYIVTVYAKGYIMKEEVVTLGPNDYRTVEMRLEKGDMPPGMVLVSAGEFLCGVDKGSPDEQPQRRIDLPSFYIDKHKVTNIEFKQVFPSHTYEEDRANYPITGVSFRQAVAYAEAVGKRLPTELEWEKAARGTDGREYPWGNKFDPKLCNCSSGKSPRLQKVGMYRGGASPYGCEDMAGNAYEWTSSWYEAYPGNTVIKKEYGQVFRVLRGGSFRTEPFHVRCARRHYDRMETARDDYGFRCVKDVTGHPQEGQSGG